MHRNINLTDEAFGRLSKIADDLGVEHPEGGHSHAHCGTRVPDEQGKYYAVYIDDWIVDILEKMASKIKEMAAAYEGVSLG